MKSIFTIVIFLLSMSLVNGQVQTNPRLVVLEIFKAAQTGQYETLIGLCDPRGECDGDAKRICNLINQPEEERSRFNEAFKTGRIDGNVVFKGQYAQVNILFGPESNKKETIVLVKRDKLWYLLGM